MVGHSKFWLRTLGDGRVVVQDERECGVFAAFWKGVAGSSGQVDMFGLVHVQGHGWFWGRRDNR